MRRDCRPGLLAGAAVLFLVCVAAFPAAAGQKERWAPLVARLVGDGVPRAEAAGLFSRPEVRFRPEVIGKKMTTLFDKKFAPPRSAAGPKTPARPVFGHLLTPERVAEAREFLRRNAALLDAARRRFGVPSEVLAAMLAVETRHGGNLGSDSALTSLASLALAGDFRLVAPHFAHRPLTRAQRGWLKRRSAEKAEWAYAELKALLAYAGQSGLDPAAIPGSRYGAIGICQFMPSTALRFGVDGDGDGRTDLFSLPDAVHSTGNFLQANGWSQGIAPARQRQVIYRYNPSPTYTNTVLALAAALKG